MHWGIKITYWEGASLTCAKDKYEPYVYPSVGDGGLTVSLGILRWMIWPEQEKTHCCILTANPSAASVWLHPKSTICTQSLSSAPKIYPLHPKSTLCSCSVQQPRSQQGQTPPLHYPLLCQPLGPPGNWLCHACKACWPGHCWASHSQNFWPQKSTGNAATSSIWWWSPICD